MSNVGKRLLTNSRQNRTSLSSPRSASPVSVRSTIVLCLALVSIAAIVAAQENAAAQTSEALRLEGDVEYTHDPSIAKDGDTWYLFGTANGPNRKGELPIRCSKDLHHWSLCGSVFEKIPDWITKESPATKELWAPDISYFNGAFHLYYAYSLFGKNTSGIALVTNKTLDSTSPDYQWVDQGLVLKSVAEDDFNAIDPNLAFDTHGRAWLAFGSFWSGIKMRRIDPVSGKLSPEDSRVYSLATRERPQNAAPATPELPADWEAVEAPFIIHRGNFYYLFVS